MRVGFRGREGAMGLGRGRMEGRQRGGESSFGDGRIGLVGGGQKSGIAGGGLGGIAGGGLGGIAGGGIGPLTLVEGAKKLFQSVSGDTLNGIPAFPHDADGLTGSALPDDCTTTNRRPDGSSNGPHGLHRTSPSLIAPAITRK
jgi:hypothetical protein